MNDKTKPASEPRVRIVLSPDGVERVEVWGVDRKDERNAFSLYSRLVPQIAMLDFVAKQQIRA